MEAVALDRRAKELTLAEGYEFEGYYIATRERLQDAVKSLEYMKRAMHAIGCTYGQLYDDGNVLRMHSGCTCGLDAHKTHLSSLLGDQITK